MMSSGETLIIERRGTPIGFFVPVVATDGRAGHASLGRLGRLVDELLAQTRLDEEELVREIGAASQPG